jgi:hypothetical protein
MHSAVAVAGGLTFVYAIGSVITLAVAAKEIRIPLATIFAAFVPAAKASVVMSLFLLGWMHWSKALPPVVQLIVGVTVGAIVSLTTLRLVDPQIFLWARDIILGRPAPDILHTATP